jgi:hypothetical protein
MLLGVATLAALAEGASVRFMAARTLLMTCGGCRVDRGVTALTASLQALRSVRQAAVTTLTRSVTGQVRRLAKLLGMTVLAEGSVRRVQQERVRRVALFTADSAVKGTVGRRGLMTGAAVPRGAVRPGPRRVWVMAADAGAGGSAHRVVGVNGAVASRARLFRRSPHVVRRMARRALIVCGHARRRKGVHASVTRLTRHRPLTLEFMRPVTAHARLVTAGK